MCPQLQAESNTGNETTTALLQTIAPPSDILQSGDPDALDDPMYYPTHLMRFESPANRSLVPFDASKAPSQEPFRRLVGTPIAASFKPDLTALNFSKAFHPPDTYAHLNLRPIRMWLSLRPGIGSSEYDYSHPEDMVHGQPTAYAPHHERSFEPGQHSMDLSSSLHSENAQYVSPYELSNASSESVADTKRGLLIHGLGHAPGTYLVFNENKAPYSPTPLDPFGSLLTEPTCLTLGRLDESRSDLALEQSSVYLDAYSNLRSPNTTTSSVPLKIDMNDARKKHRPPHLRLQQGKTSAVKMPITSGQNLEIRSATLDLNFLRDYQQQRPAKTGYDRRGAVFPGSHQFGNIYHASPISVPQLSEPFRTIADFSSPLHTLVYPASMELLDLQRGFSLHQDGNLPHHGFTMAYQSHPLGISQGHRRQDLIDVPDKRRAVALSQPNGRAVEVPRPALGRSVSADTKCQPKKHTRRRLLPRSKSGCWICRIKHLKCDESRPICSLCLKFDLECDYSIEKPPYVLNPALRQEKLSRTSVLRRLKRGTDAGKTKKTADGNNSRVQPTETAQPAFDGMNAYMLKPDSLFTYNTVKTERD